MLSIHFTKVWDALTEWSQDMVVVSLHASNRVRAFEVVMSERSWVDANPLKRAHWFDVCRFVRWVEIHKALM